MDDLRPAKRPKISAKSRVFQHGSTAKTSKSNKGKGKQAAQSRNAGKLAALMSITLDIFFEVSYTCRSDVSINYDIDYNSSEAGGPAPTVPRLETLQDHVHEQVCKVAVDRSAEERRCSTGT